MADVGNGDNRPDSAPVKNREVENAHLKMIKKIIISKVLCLFIFFPNVYYKIFWILITIKITLTAEKCVRQQCLLFFFL